MRLPKDKLKRTADISVLVLAFVIPPDFTRLTWLSWRHRHLPDPAGIFVLHGHLLKQPRIFLPIAFYLYIFAGFFFSHNKGEALSSWSEKLPYLLYR